MNQSWAADDLINQLDGDEFEDINESDVEPDALEKILTLAVPLIAAALARKVVGAAWKASTGRTPPKAGSDGATSASVVLMWGAATGAAVGAARIMAERQATKFARARRSD